MIPRLAELMRNYWRWLLRLSCTCDIISLQQAPMVQQYISQMHETIIHLGAWGQGSALCTPHCCFTCILAHGFGGGDNGIRYPGRLRRACLATSTCNSCSHELTEGLTWSLWCRVSILRAAILHSTFYCCSGEFWVIYQLVLLIVSRRRKFVRGRCPKQLETFCHQLLRWWPPSSNCETTAQKTTEWCQANFDVLWIWLHDRPKFVRPLHIESINDPMFEINVIGLINEVRSLYALELPQKERKRCQFASITKWCTH